MQNSEYIYFLEWMHENYNISYNKLLDECRPRNCGWVYNTENENLKVIQQCNDEEFNIEEILDTLFNWAEWNKKFRGLEFEKISLIDEKWKESVHLNNKMAKFSRLDILSLEQFDFNFDLKFG